MKLGELEKLIETSIEKGLAPMRERQTSIEEKLLATPSRGSAAGEITKGLTLARSVLALAAVKGHPGLAVDWAKKSWAGRDGLDFVLKALSTADLTAGGALVDGPAVQEVIELLRARSVFRELNPTIVKTEGPVPFAQITGGTVAQYISENADKPVTQMETGEVVVNPKEIAALCPISNKLIRMTNGNADEIVRKDLVRAVTLRSDLAFIRGNGLQDTPKGLASWTPAANKIPATQAGATATLAEVTTDFSKLRLALVNANVAMTNPVYIWAPRTTEFLRALRDGNGNLVYADELSRGMFNGRPFRETTQIPTTLGGSSNESEIYLVDLDDVVIGEAPQMMIDASGEASYKDALGVVHSAYQKNQTVVRISTANDLIMRHAASVAMLTAVKWGA